MQAPAPVFRQLGYADFWHIGRRSLVVRALGRGPVYARVRWVDRTLAQIAGECVMNELLPLLQSYGDPDDHRVIYWTW